MNPQLDLWGKPRRARQSDPVTSHEATAVNERGLNTQAGQVLALIRIRPGGTIGELAHVWKTGRDVGLNRAALSKRCPELEREGKIRRGMPRKCSRTGSKQLPWYAL